MQKCKCGEKMTGLNEKTKEPGLKGRWWWCPKCGSVYMKVTLNESEDEFLDNFWLVPDSVKKKDNDKRWILNGR